MTEAPDPVPSASTSDPAEIPGYFARNVHAVTEMHLQGERVLGVHQRAIEWCTARLGRPSSIYVILAVVLLWTLGNTVAAQLDVVPPDPAPFFWLQGMIGLLALVATTMVLTTQIRQAKLLERRMHLDLQINLLTEQKAAKLIELLEELRRDLPNVRNRPDSEAESMQRAAEPLKLMAALEEHQTVEAVREALAADATAVAVDAEEPEEPATL